MSRRLTRLPDSTGVEACRTFRYKSALVHSNEKGAGKRNDPLDLNAEPVR
jgi:hypothetical protein